MTNNINLIQALSLFIIFSIATITSSSQPTPQSRGYLTTPDELIIISDKASNGLEPYVTALKSMLLIADTEWDFRIRENEICEDADTPKWLDNSGGAPIIYARSISFHLTQDSYYAEEVKNILESIMTTVKNFSFEEQRCRLVVSWGIPEFVASADLIEAYWYDKKCTGPITSSIDDSTIGTGLCKELFQNWLAKTVYYLVSLSGEDSQDNWGAAATTTMAYIADYLWDRDDIILHNRLPEELYAGQVTLYTPAEAYDHANTLAIERMNGYRVNYHSRYTCDYLFTELQNDQWEPIKSQIAPSGIIPQEARREEYCNIPVYNGNYQNYPQLHIGHNIQQCELMLRRRDSSCYDNIDMQDIPDFTFIDPNGNEQTTHLYPRRGSLERAINAVIIDSMTEWRHDPALEVAYRYYSQQNQFDNIIFWYQEIDELSSCYQDLCLTTLTHGFAPGEILNLPPTVPPPR